MFVPGNVYTSAYLYQETYTRPHSIARVGGWGNLGEGVVGERKVVPRRYHVRICVLGNVYNTCTACLKHMYRLCNRCRQYKSTYIYYRPVWGCGQPGRGRRRRAKGCSTAISRPHMCTGKRIQHMYSLSKTHVQTMQQM